MTETERHLLNTIKENLEKSIKRDWGHGDVEAWYDYVLEMKNSINNSVSILEVLISKEKNPIELINN